MKEGRIRFGYKAFRQEEAIFSLYQIESQGGVRFWEGKKTIPQRDCGPLTVFKTKRAVRFLATNTTMQHCKCFKVVYKLSTMNKVWHTYQERNIEELEESNLNTILPGQTVLAEWIIPVEEVKFKVRR